MSAADLLRGLRVVGSVLSFTGRYRAASLVAVVLASGWFLRGLL